MHWPATPTQGIEKHIEDLKAMFVWPPETRIKEHPVKVAHHADRRRQDDSADWQGLQDPHGDLRRWNSQGTMDEGYLFRDNQEFMKQIK